MEPGYQKTVVNIEVTRRGISFSLLLELESVI